MRKVRGKSNLRKVMSMGDMRNIGNIRNVSGIRKVRSNGSMEDSVVAGASAGCIRNGGR